jgi:hypothetical protein
LMLSPPPTTYPNHDNLPHHNSNGITHYSKGVDRSMTRMNRFVE